jgi:hypothetical protein
MTTQDSEATRFTSGRPARCVKAVSVAAATLMALGGMAAAAISTSHNGGPAARSVLARLTDTSVSGQPGSDSAADAIHRSGDAYRSAYGNGDVTVDSVPAPAPATLAAQPRTKPVVGINPAQPAAPKGSATPVSQGPVRPAAPSGSATPANQAPAQPSAPSGSATPANQAPAQPSAPSGSATPANQDPAQSRPPSAEFESSCFGSSFNAAACDKAALSDIDNALAAEGYGPLPLPSDYSSLSTVGQLIAVANAERTVRGLPAMAENGSLDSRAYQGAQSGTDPTGPSGYAWGSNLAMGYPTALSADYVWMYDDGTNSPNVDCHSAGDSGCWGHRHNILIQGSGQAGAAVYNNNGSTNLTQLFVVNY